MAYRYTLDTHSYTNQPTKTKDQLTDMMKTTMHSNNQFHNNCSEWKDDHIVKFKVFLEEVQRQRIRKIKLPLQTLSIDHLEAQIVKCFKVEPEDLKRMTLCHQDKEKDLIITTAISSDEELHSAISAFVTSKHTVCLRVTMKNSSSSKKKNEAATPAVVGADANSEQPTVSVNALTTVDRMNSALLNEIEAKGFTNKRQNIRLLKKHNGNVDEVIQVLTEQSVKRKKRTEKRKSAPRLPDTEPSKRDHEAINNKNPQHKMKLEGVADKSSSLISATDDEKLNSLLTDLEAKGFTHKRQNIRLMRKHNGDVDRVIQVLTNKSAKRQKRMVMNATDESSFGSVLCELEAKGFSNKRLNIRLLKKHDHNVDNVIQVLTQISEKRQEKRKNRVSKPQEAYEELRPLLSELETKGFTNKRKNIRLLKKHGNEVGKVLQILSGRRQAILARREARLALKGTKQQINQAA